MSLPFYITGEEIVQTFGSVFEAMTGHEDLIFAAMQKITSNEVRKFEPPKSVSEFAKKRMEIENIFRYPRAVRGVDIAMKLLEEIYFKVNSQGGLPGLKPTELLFKIKFNDRGQKVSIKLTEECRWIVEWQIRLHIPGKETSSEAICDVHHQAWGVVVPNYVIRYIHSGINAYDENLNEVAIALLSIAAEATLRDALYVKGYKFEHGASNVDVYEYFKAKVTADVTNDYYMLKFSDSLPKSTTDFVSLFGPNGTEIQVKRQIKKRTPPKTDRLDLHMLVDSNMVDFWSGDQPSSHAKKSIGGLGEALRIARNVEKTLTATELPVDFDDVLKAVRNNLIHLSGVALDTILPQYQHLARPGRDFLLSDFLNDQELLYDFMIAIPRFITNQYLELRKAGHYAS